MKSQTIADILEVYILVFFALAFPLGTGLTAFYADIFSGLFVICLTFTVLEFIFIPLYFIFKKGGIYEGSLH